MTTETSNLTVSERFIKLSSKLPFPSDIQLGQDLTLTINGQTYLVNCVKEDHLDNQDGTINIIYSIKWLGQ